MFLNTTVVDTERDGSGKVVSITAVQRTPKNGYTPYSENLSDVLADWYSPDESHRFTKQTMKMTGKVRRRQRRAEPAAAHSMIPAKRFYAGAISLLL